MTWGYPEDDRREATTATRSPTKRKARPIGTIIATHDYINEQGLLAFQVVRDDKKDFYPRRPNIGRDPKEPEWLYGLGNTPRILYHLPEVRRAVAQGTVIFVVEGEKDADTLANIGLTATTNPGGVGMGWTSLHASEIEGAEWVVILPDNDEAGLKHALSTRRLLRGKVRRVRIVNLPDLPQKGDVSDWIAAGHTREELETLCQAPANPTGWTSAHSLMENEMPETEWIIPNVLSTPSIAVLSGWSGAFKSWVALDTCLQLATGGRFVGKRPLGKPRRVMYLTADEDAIEVRRKLIMLKNGTSMNGESEATLGQNMLVRIAPLDMTADRDFFPLLDAIADFAPDLVAMDHLRLVLPGDENSSEYAARLKERTAQIHAEQPCCLLFLHHWRKLAKERQLNEPGQRARGTGALRGVMDHHLTIERSEQSDPPRAVFRVEKNRKGLEPPPFEFLMRFATDGSTAGLEYEGTAFDSTEATSPQARILELLERHKPQPILQSDIVRSLGFSRTTVRDAINKLSDAGKVITATHGNSRLVHLKRYAPDIFPGGGAAESGGIAPPPDVKPYRDDD